jgi:AcrR family transcriptional regulator
LETESAQRSRILSAARAQFLAQGFARTTIDGVVGAARVSKQSFYELFRDKGALFEAVMHSAIQPTNEPAPARDLQTCVRRMSDSYAAPELFGLIRANIVASRRFPEIAAAINEHQRRSAVALAQHLATGVALGRLTDAGPPLELATRLGGMAVEGTRHHLGYPLPGETARRAQADLAVAVFQHGWRAGVNRRESSPAQLQAAAEPRRTRLTPERLQGLCDAAAEAFLTHGVEEASLDGIAAAAKVGRATLFRQFGGKDGLFTFVCRRETERVMADVVATPAAGDLLFAVAELAEAVLDRHLEPRSLAFHRLLIEEADRRPQIAQAFYDAQGRRASAPFAELLAQAGQGSPAPPVRRMFHTLATFGVRFIANPSTPDLAERRRLSLQAARIILDGLETSAPGGR